MHAQISRRYKQTGHAWWYINQLNYPSLEFPKPYHIPTLFIVHANALENSFISPISHTYGVRKDSVLPDDFLKKKQLSLPTDVEEVRT